MNDAKVLCQELIKSNPDDAEGWFLLGAINGALFCFDEAEDCCRKSIALHTDMPATHYNLGIALLNQYKSPEAEQSFLTALKLKPDYFEAYCDLGNAYKVQRKFDSAIACYHKSLDINPAYAMAYSCLSSVYYDRGELDQAIHCYRKVVELTASDGARIRLATAVPLINESNRQIDELRSRISNNIDFLMQQNLHVEDPVHDIGITNFFLAYHGRDDKMLQTKLARLYEHSCPSITYVAEHCRSGQHCMENRKTRIGFISRYFMDHSIGKTSKGIIEYLSRDQFEVYVYFLSPPDDETGLHIQRCADHATVLPNDLGTARTVIAEHELDILFYQDIGMDIFTFFLAFSRLAPVQCTSFGHPVTTGISTLDYYISTDMWEPGNGEQHYSEQLVRLRSIPSVAYYYKPGIPATLKSRTQFGLNGDYHIYICPQALFKFHPDFDDILSAILRRDEKGRLVLIEGSHSHWTSLLMDRFRRSMPDVLDRVKFVPQQRGADFINLIAISDVMLDTTHFCGFNTTLEGFATGTPVVSLPGEFMRSRHTMSFYDKMNMPR